MLKMGAMASYRARATGWQTDAGVYKTGAGHPALSQLQQMGQRQSWLWASGTFAIALLVLGAVSLLFAFPAGPAESYYTYILHWSVRGLIGVVLLFGLCATYLQVQTFRLRNRLMEAEKLFYLIGDNAADLIAIVDTEGRRLYNSPSYEKVLGYSSEELQTTSGLEQIHPEDRAQVIEAAEEAKRTGTGRRLEYRIRHKNGSWRILESTASAVRDAQGKI